MTNDRHVAPSTESFVKGAGVPAQTVKRLEGRPEGSGAASLALKQLLVGNDMVLLELKREKGLIDPEHAHPDHESICYLVSGKMRVVIDGESFIAGPGDSWIHPAGVAHYHETLEDSVQIEIKSPPRKTWG